MYKRQVETTCASFNCPLAKCGATTTSSFVREVTCSGVSLWAWPQGVHLAPPPADRRQLGECGDGRAALVDQCGRKAKANAFFDLDDCLDNAVTWTLNCALAKQSQ